MATHNGQETQTHFRTCNLCEAVCGVEIKVSDGHIVSIKGDKDDPFSAGHICPKAVALQDLHEDPDRLRQPLKRTDSGWEAISWDEAFELVTHKLHGIKQEFGKNAVGVYAGNPNVHNVGSLLTLLPFLKALGTKTRFSATSNDQLPNMLANLEMFGHQALFPIPDIDRTSLFVCIGGNPVASNGSLMTAPGFRHRLKALQARGGRLVVIDPRRTETADMADQHIPVRPGTDALMLSAILNVIFSEKLENLGELAPICKDLDVLRVAVMAFTPEKVAEATGIAAETLRTLAREIATTPQAVVYGRVGISTQTFGGLNAWLIYAINIVTGHLDQAGGALFTHPAIDLIELGSLGGQRGHFDRYRSRVKDLPEFGGELPSSTMADEILTPGDGQIRAMVTMAGNPVLSSPNGRRLDHAFAQLDFMVSIDFYLNETTRHAHVILPPTGPLEHSHYDLVFNFVAVRNVAKYSPPLFKAPKDSKHDWEIFTELTRRLLLLSGKKPRWQIEAQHRLTQSLGVEGILDLMLRVGPYGTPLKKLDGVLKPIAEAAQRFLPSSHPLQRLLASGPYNSRWSELPKGLCLEELKRQPHGIDLGPLRPSLPDRLYTRDLKIQLAPRLFLADLPRLAEALDTKVSSTQLHLIGRRHVRCNNSWMHNSERLVKGPERCTLQIHPRDAAKAGLTDGAKAEVESEVGQVVIVVEITDRVMPGVVSIPHGWGHHRGGIRLSVAQQHPGVSLNDLVSDQQRDALTGTSVLNGVPVTVRLHQPRQQRSPARKGGEKRRV